MKPRNLLLVILAVLLFANFGFVSEMLPQSTSIAMKTEVTSSRRLVADFTLKDELNDTSFTLYQYTDANKVVIIQFMATWCPYCHNQLPDLSKLYNRGSGNVIVISVSVDSDDAEINPTSGKSKLYGDAISNSMNWLVALDTVNLWNNSEPNPDYFGQTNEGGGIPTMLVISPSRTIIWSQTGYSGTEYDDIVPEILEEFSADTTAPDIVSIQLAPDSIQWDTLSVRIFGEINESLGIHEFSCNVTNLQTTQSLVESFDLLDNGTWNALVMLDSFNLQNSDILEFYIYAEDWSGNIGYTTIQRSIQGDNPNVDVYAPSISSVTINPTEVDRTTKTIIITLYASDDSGIASMRLDLCSNTTCYQSVEMTEGMFGRWTADLDVTSIMTLPEETIFIKLTATDTRGNTETHSIMTLNLGPVAAGWSPGVTILLTGFAMIILFLGRKKRNRH
ncbi:MAG: TlpA family protein disulfide reductase [Candidatus Hodarchaeota archaeon]